MKFEFTLVISLLFLSACRIVAVNKPETELNNPKSYKWDVPTMGYQKITFNGPLKNVKIKNTSIDGSFTINSIGIEASSKSTDQFPENLFFEFDRYGLNTSMTIVRDTAVLQLSLDSLKFWQKQEGFDSFHYLNDVKKFESFKNTYPVIQKYPNFLSVPDFAPPLYFPVSQTQETKLFSAKDSALILSGESYGQNGSIDVYQYEFIENLDTRYLSTGLLNLFFYSDTIFNSIGHKLDTIYNCYNRTRTEYIYNEKGLVVEKKKLFRIS